MFGQHRMSPQEKRDAEATVAFYRARGGSKFTALTTTLIRMRDAFSESSPAFADRLAQQRAHENAVAVAAVSFGFVTRAQFLNEARRRGLDEAWFWEQGLMADLDVLGRAA